MSFWARFLRCLRQAKDDVATTDEVETIHEGLRSKGHELKSSAAVEAAAMDRAADVSRRGVDTAQEVGDVVNDMVRRMRA